MSKIKLFIATTIDGFIAREDGSLDWLFDLPNPNNNDYGYHAFYSGIGAVVMGRETYEEVLAFDVDWPYGNCKTFVITAKPEYEVKTPDTVVIQSIDNQTIRQIKSASHKDVWVVGGGKTISAFLNNDAIDEMLLSIIPVILGKGLPLFPDQPKETRFEISGTDRFETGVVNLHYVKKNM
jgi:dihydrofolate reductase